MLAGLSPLAVSARFAGSTAAPGSAPTNSTLPVIFGGTEAGNELATTNGIWANTPILSYAYQWYEDDVAIVGATSNSFVLTEEQVGADITVGVIATNAAGPSTEAISAAVGPITSSVTAPVLTQTSSDGENPMSWSGEYTDMLVGTDYITCRWRVDGGAWTDETDHLFTSDDYLDSIDGAASFAWPLFAAHTFLSGEVVDVQEGVKRDGVTYWSSTLSDTMAGSVTYAHGGDAESNVSGGNITHSAQAFPAGNPVLVVVSYNNRPTAVSVNGVACTMVHEYYRSGNRGLQYWVCGTAVSAGNYDIVVSRPSNSTNHVIMFGCLTNANLTPTETQASSPAGQSQPHLTPSFTVPSNGLALCAFFEEGGASITPGTCNAGTDFVAEENTTQLSATAGIVIATKDESGQASFNFAFGTYVRMATVFGP